MKSQAQAVVIGGGVGGAAILYWLTRLGWSDTVLVERSRVTSGSPFHSAGLVGQLRSSLSLTRMMMNSVELYRTLRDEVGLETGWHEVGSLRLASSQERMEGLDRDGGGRCPGSGGGQSRPPCRWSWFRRKGRSACSRRCRPTACLAPPSSPPTG